MTQKNEFTKARVEAAFAFCCSEDGTLPRFDTVFQLNIHFIILTLVYVHITLLWRYFTLEITLGSKKNYTVFSAITNCQT